MSQIKQLLKTIPGKIGADQHVQEMSAKAMTLMYDYDVTQPKGEGAFKRIGNTKKECKQRLFPIFSIIDGLVQYHNADNTKAEESKKLLLLASTPVEEEQVAIRSEYPEESGTFDLSVQDATQIGARAVWNH